MIEIDAHHWSQYLQPIIEKEFIEAKIYSLDEYLRCGHEFTDLRKPNYVIRLYFDDPLDETAFKLRYEIK
jgi:hypothetical protein